MLDIKNISEIDQLAIITSEEDVKICLSNLENLDTDSTYEEKDQFCRMICTEDKNAEICSILIESDNQII
ncbi:hypothetical protein [Candidatus Mesenet endosymbiont of Phosphuga atrata]|uniref:hypothetical protein n=1 Tax=Candidatus Mesenet endosymbiont of Phosphuga atrata TaxID=3066221 RepID=UPI0030CDB33C